jgi:hypothetical protein
MIWWLLVLSGAATGAWLKRAIWRRSYNGIRGWFRRRWFHVKQKYKQYRRWKFRRGLMK